MERLVLFSAGIEASAIRALNGDGVAVHVLGDQVCDLRREGLRHDGINAAARCVYHAKHWCNPFLFNISLCQFMLAFAKTVAFMQATGVG